MNTEKTESGYKSILKGDGIVRLHFLVDFMKMTGHSVESLSSTLGYKSRQAVYHWFVNDDVKMERLYELFDRCGYDITFSLVPKKAKKSGPAELSIELEEDNAECDSRLSFLYNAIRKSRMTYDELAKKTGVKSRITVYHWLTAADNCKISQAYLIADALEMKMKIDIKKRKKKQSL